MIPIRIQKNNLHIFLYQNSYRGLYICWVLIKLSKLLLHFLLDILTGGFMMSVISLWVIVVTWYETDTFEHIDLVYQSLKVSWCSFALLVTLVMQFNTSVTELNQIMSQTHHKAHSAMRCTRQWVFTLSLLGFLITGSRTYVRHHIYA